jgi:hypothetical protein
MSAALVMTAPEAMKAGVCGARTRHGGLCRRPAGWGTPHTVGRCKLHGGCTPTGLAAAARQEALAEVGFLSALDDVGRLGALQAVVSPGYRRLAQTATRAGADHVLLRLHGEMLDRAARLATAAVDSRLTER